MESERLSLEELDNLSKQHWEEQEQVERFASLDTDVRLVNWVKSQKTPETCRILDLGCAGGRNTEWLFSRGIDTYALDRSRAMVSATRLRVQQFADCSEQKKRILLGDIGNMTQFHNEMFDLVFAVGIIQSAVPLEKWQQAAREIVRVLKPGGELLVSNFSPRSRPEHTPLNPIPGHQHCFTGFGIGALCLMDEKNIDEQMKLVGLRPLVPSYHIRVDIESGFRISVNGHYKKA